MLEYLEPTGVQLSQLATSQAERSGTKLQLRFTSLSCIKLILINTTDVTWS